MTDVVAAPPGRAAVNRLQVTVGVPTFNRAAWLGQTIESVLSQTFTSLRLIVSDNASDDDTPEVVRSYADDRIEYVRSERNVGAIANLNGLIALAETEFLILLPDDDLLYPNHVGSCVEALERFATAGLVHSAFDLIDAESHVQRTMNPLASRTKFAIERKDRALQRMMVSSWPICFPSVMYRTQAIVEAGGIPEGGGSFADLQLWMRIALDWDFGYIARPLAGFRLHRESASATMVTDRGAPADERELIRLHSRMRYEQRISFLDDVRLGSHQTARLRSRAALQYLIDSAGLGLPWRVVAARLATLVRTSPWILSRPALWRLVAAQLGGRYLRSVVRAASTRAGWGGRG